MRAERQQPKVALPAQLLGLKRNQCAKPSSSLDHAPELSETEFATLQAFLREAINQATQSHVRLLYRGDRRDALGERMCGSDPHAPVEKVAGAVFYFGEKGKHFWRQDFRKRVEPVGMDQVITSLDDLSKKSFERILSKFNEILHGFGQKNWVMDFEKDQPPFCNAIRTSRTELVEKFCKLDDGGKRLVRDSYLYALHTCSRRDCRCYTPFVSATQDYNKAANLYARNPETMRADERSCLICILLPKQHDQWVYSASRLKKQARDIEALGFPSLQNGFFREVEEAAFVGGIFPHFVYGIYQPSVDHFLCNPAVLKACPDPSSFIWRQGLRIEQVDFDGRAQQETVFANGIEYLADDLKEFGLEPPNLQPKQNDRWIKS